MGRRLRVLAACALFAIQSSVSFAGGSGFGGEHCSYNQSGSWTEASVWLEDSAYVNVFTTPAGPQYCYIGIPTFEWCSEDSYIYTLPFSTGNADIKVDHSNELRDEVASFEGIKMLYTHNWCTGAEKVVASNPISMTLSFVGHDGVYSTSGSRTSGRGKARAQCRYSRSYRAASVAGTINNLPFAADGMLSKHRLSIGCAKRSS